MADNLNHLLEGIDLKGKKGTTGLLLLLGRWIIMDIIIITAGTRSIIHISVKVVDIRVAGIREVEVGIHLLSVGSERKGWWLI